MDRGQSGECSAGPQPLLRFEVTAAPLREPLRGTGWYVDHYTAEEPPVFGAVMGS